MTIYADQMFLENFIINYIILYLTSYFSGFEKKWYKLSISAALGALYVIASYIFGFYDSQMILLKILLSIIMVLIGFKFQNIKSFCKILLFFYAITFAMGGISFGLAYFLELYTISDGGVIYIEEFPFFIIFVGIVIGVFIYKILLLYIRRWENINQLLYKIELEFEEEKLEVVAFLDSGHNVVEPITHYPVIMIEEKCLKNLYDKNTLDNFQLGKINNLNESLSKRIRIIPISTVSSDNEVMIGIRFSRMAIFLENKKYISNPIVIPCQKKLSENGRYQALISKSLI